MLWGIILLRFELITCRFAYGRTLKHVLPHFQVLLIGNSRKDDQESSVESFCFIWDALLLNLMLGKLGNLGLSSWIFLSWCFLDYQWLFEKYWRSMWAIGERLGVNKNVCQRCWKGIRDHHLGISVNLRNLESFWMILGS